LITCASVTSNGVVALALTLGSPFQVIAGAQA
jgi:hypothetical protein